MFNEVCHSVFSGFFIPRTGINDKSAMSDQAIGFVMDDSYTIAEYMSEELHYRIISGSKCTISAK
jgi:hypothetical protein